MMLIRRAVAALTVTAATAPLLTGCDRIIWGAEGAHVIATTEHLITAGQAGDYDDIACEDTVANFGTRADWEGLSAGEPEQYSGDYFREQAALDPSWHINLELIGRDAVTGVSFPGDVFWRDTSDGLCVTDIVWSTVM